jgi:hypothetical protein
MFYQAFAGIPEWAPSRENHILYSAEVLTNIKYSENQVSYSTSSTDGIEYLRLAFKPLYVSLNGNEIILSDQLVPGTWTMRDLGTGDYAIEISRQGEGKVVISGSETKLIIDITSHMQQIESFRWEIQYLSSTGLYFHTYRENSC